MALKFPFVALLSAMVGLAACNSPEELERKNLEFQKRHFVGKSSSGNTRYQKELTGVGALPPRKNELLGHTNETVKLIPVSELPKPDLGGFTARLFQGWCEQDGFGNYKIVENKHNGNFEIRVWSSGRSYSPLYDVTVECFG